MAVQEFVKVFLRLSDERVITELLGLAARVLNHLQVQFFLTWGQRRSWCKKQGG